MILTLKYNKKQLKLNSQIILQQFNTLPLRF
jgi:hypothetical protein